MGIRKWMYNESKIECRGGDGTPKVGVLVGMGYDHTRMHVI